MEYKNTTDSVTAGNKKVVISPMGYSFGGAGDGLPYADRFRVVSPMSVQVAVSIFIEAQQYPQYGNGWPMGARQRRAQEVINANPGCLDQEW